MLRFAVWEPHSELEVFTLKPEFYQKWEPNITKHKLFGIESQSIQTTDFFPKQHDFDRMPLTKQIKLCKITYKVYSCKTKQDASLKAIKLHFTNGVSSPLFEGEKSEILTSVKKVKEVIDVSRRISKVRMYVYGHCMQHLQFLDASGGEIVDIGFY